MHVLVTGVLTLLFSTVTAWDWPDVKLSVLDHARWDQKGHNGGAIAGLVTPCNVWLNGLKSGRANAADWIRTAYHDMATHNSDDGTGGLDASIRFDEELHRPENAGNSFDLAIVHLGSTVNRYVSLADALAAAMVVSVENCAGPEIPFRGGRVDAPEPGPSGVPQPDQPLATHIESFRKQGFTQEEMIGLVACGHSFGGVQSKFFPDVVPELNDPNNTESSTHFDSTFFTFDNKVATEYVAGTTGNPLVVGTNDTFNSDKRIFQSDANVTMQAFAESPDLFFSTCRDLFTRMIDTVPNSVQLTEVLDPKPFKPHNVALNDISEGVLQLNGELRVWNAAPTNVTILVKDAAGHEDSASTVHTSDMVGTSTAERYSSSWYSFNLTVSSAVSMSFLIDGRLEDQAGKGYVVDDSIMFSASSCLVLDETGDGVARYDIAIRKDRTPKRVSVEQDVTDHTGGPSVQTTDASTTPLAMGAYSIWRVSDVPIGSGATAVAELDDGTTIEAALNRATFTLPHCTV
ncbi:heme peroxidase [Exidia glandulosa HHB12029]|uniref:Peroxidase n=1 Tax=Exidia glandulosa HHB12029 TaxID=1314781 RepID=A0A165H5U8_EXIGL|nr:heme peroxidase [Exidia glandulosa HHB12029]